ncbi:MAG: 6-methylsalicylate decarboxylase [Solirubrobacteraceae bacterium]|jgi:hypothetical protein|nr:6-methylsalicylate decarboxylase [Solirubrobacteraceae bacterium]
MLADLHQHPWPDALLRELARRNAPPRLVRRGDGWTLELAGERPAPLALADHDPAVRALQAQRDEVDLIGIAPYFDVSSYGPRTVDAMLRVVGVDRLVHGTDRPVIAPVGLSELGDSVRHALRTANPERLLTPVPAPA